eukprot:1868974-Amphidinium_carterae.3
MSKLALVTQKEFIQKLHEVKVAVEGIAGVSALKGRREVVFTYRGIKVPFTVSSIQKEVELCMRLRLRAEACGSGELDALPCENAFVKAVEGQVCWKIGKSLLTAAKKARSHFWDCLREKPEAERDGDAVEANWTKKSPSYRKKALKTSGKTLFRINT